jgi:hypothetical protein
MEANCAKKTTMAAAAGLWSSRLACLVIIGQITWAVFGKYITQSERERENQERGIKVAGWMD